MTCTGGSLTGNVRGYDNQGQLVQWQNTPGSSTFTDSFIYDGAGTRVEWQVTQSGSTTGSVYEGNLEEAVINDSATATMKYYYISGQRIAKEFNALGPT